MSLTAVDRALLQAAANCGQDWPDGSSKCDRVLRAALESYGTLDHDAEVALCCSGYEDNRVRHLYDQLRSLVDRGLLFGRGNLKLPAGPRYTECGITSAGRTALESLT
jgi:hypothetical protein